MNIKKKFLILKIDLIINIYIINKYNYLQIFNIIKAL